MSDSTVVYGTTGRRRLSTNETVVVLAGQQGPSGQSFGFNWKGDWSASTLYVVDDGVLGPDGLPYIAIAPSTNVSPPAAEWELLMESPNALGVPFTPAGSVAATNVQAAIEEVDADVTAHVGDASGAHAASAIAFTPAGSIAAATVQAAVEEVDSDVTAHVGDASGAHAASAIAFTPAGTIAAATVQAAIEEASGDLTTHKSADDHTGYALLDGTRPFTAVIGGVTPASAEHLATKGYVDDRAAVVTNGARVYYLQESVASDIGGYKVALPTPPALNQHTTVTACSGTGDTAVEEFATPLGVPNITSLPSGTAIRHFHARVSAGVARLKVELYKRTSGGTETLLRSGYSSNFSNTAIDEISWTFTDSSSHAMNATDRIVFKVFAARVSGPASINVTIYWEGSAEQSYITTTIQNEILASDVVNTPSGSVAATTVQAAINELSLESARRLTSFTADAGNTSTGETDINSYTVPAGTLSANGQVLSGYYHGSLAANANAKTGKIYIAGTQTTLVIGNLNNLDWHMDFRLVRVSNTVIRCWVIGAWNGLAATYMDYFEVTGLDLAASTFIIKLTGTGGATNDFVCRWGQINFEG